MYCECTTVVNYTKKSTCVKAVVLYSANKIIYPSRKSSRETSHAKAALVQ